MSMPSDSKQGTEDPTSKSPQPAAGGVKKVLYTVNKIRQMGVAPAAKAMRSNNACKACGLGMGGVLGGMTNELGEFPAVCNKSVQAQSTDVQPPIPLATFAHDLHELQALNERELAHLGRLNNPLWKPIGADRFTPISWAQALEYAVMAFRRSAPDRSMFYSSGRSSNEAGFLLQLFARVFGTNNVNNCSYYCHQATSEGLASSIGTGTATVELADLKIADLVFVIGANPASNHPRFLHLLQGVRERGGEVVVINPARERGLVRFAVPKSAKSLASGGTWIASHYLQPRIGSDQRVMQGIAKALLELGGEDADFLASYTNQFAAYRDSLAGLDWQTIEQETGLGRKDLATVARCFGASQRTVFAWGMGITHHLNGVANVEEIANLALLRGMAGKRGAGLLPLRGHSNVQGIGTIGVKPVLPKDVMRSLEQHLQIQLPTTKGMDTMAALKAASRGEIDAALFLGGNLYSATPDSTWAAQALAKIDFKLFLTTTLNRGHLYGAASGASLILPVAARDEEQQATTQESMFSYVRLSDGGITRLDNVRPESAVIADLAQAVVPDSPVDFAAFKSHTQLRDAIAAVVPGMEALASIDVARREFHIKNRVLHRPEFNTPDGRANFVVNTYAPLRRGEAYPFTLATVRSEGQFNTIVYEDDDSYRAPTHRWSVMMNAQDIAEAGLRAGDRVNLHSAQGSMTGVEVFVHDLPRGDLMAYFPEANLLISTNVDQRSKTPAFKSTPVRIEPLLSSRAGGDTNTG